MAHVDLRTQGSLGRAAKRRLAATSVMLASLALLAAAILTPISAKSRTGGSLDATFGTGGIVVTGNGEPGAALRIQPDDGKLVVAGGRGGFTVARYRPNGGLDTSFGAGGIVHTSLGGSDGAGLALALQADGKAVVAGSSYASGSTDFALVRYNANGSLDTTFGHGGIVLTDVSGSGASDEAEAVAIQPDGRIVAAGYASVGLASAGFAVARYNADGSLDTTFGVGGIVVTTGFRPADTAVGASGVVIQGDGKIVVAGSSSALGIVSRVFALARYNVNGSLDASFGTGGRVATELPGGSGIANAVVLQADGRIIAGGSIHPRLGADFGLVRYNTDGNLDTSFGAGGIVRTDFGATDFFGSSLAIQRDGRILAVGFSDAAGSNDFALARYRVDGSLDATFGTGGKVLTDFGGASGNDEGYALAIQNNGRIIAAGSSFFFTGGFALARYNP